MRREIAARAWRCVAPACDGDSRPNTQSTGIPSAAANSTRILEPEERRDRTFQSVDPRVRNGDAAAEAGAAQLLPLFDTVDHAAGIERIDRREASREIGEDLLLGIGANDADSVGIELEQSRHTVKTYHMSANAR